MREQEVLQVLAEVEAIVTNSHVVYTSGKHGTTYVNKDALYPHTAETSRLCRAIAERFEDDKVRVVIAPAIGGVILSQWVAHHLSSIWYGPVFAVYAEKVVLTKGGTVADYDITEEVFKLRRGYDKLVSGKRVLVVEDVVTTGDSARKVVEAVRAVGGEVIGVAVLCNRGGITATNLGVPKFTDLVNLPLEAWDEKDCPLCQQGVSINTDLGHGREFLARKRA